MLGPWCGDGSERARYWLHLLTEIKNRGVDGVLMLVCDGLKGLPDSVTVVWLEPGVQNLMRKIP